MSTKKKFFVFLLINVISGRLKDIVFSISMFEIVILQYIGWCVLIIRVFLFNQLSYFCQFLMDNFGQSVMSLYILGRC
jgi:hypothetical protein